MLALAGGELVIAHSDDLHELSHGAEAGVVGSMTLADLRTLCPQLPTLDEALRFFAEEAPRVGVHVDLKSPSALPEVARGLARFGLDRAEPGELVPPRRAARPRAARAGRAGRRVFPS